MFQGVLQGSYILVFDQCYINLAFLWWNYDCRISTRGERERERERVCITRGFIEGGKHVQWVDSEG